jgi:uncharacterized membrane protein YuzA (DUF378 family)
MNKQKETKKGEQAFNKQFLNRLARAVIFVVAHFGQGILCVFSVNIARALCDLSTLMTRTYILRIGIISSFSISLMGERAFES